MRIRFVLEGRERLKLVLENFILPRPYTRYVAKPLTPDELKSLMGGGD